MLNMVLYDLAPVGLIISAERSPVTITVQYLEQGPRTGPSFERVNSHAPRNVKKPRTTFEIPHRCILPFLLDV
jgi:hypothetical protein